MTTYRQIFSRFRNSRVGQDTKSFLYSEQLGMCPSCFKPYPYHKLEIHHLRSVKILEEQKDLHNLTNPKNLVLLCRSCNAKQGAKIDERFI